MGLDLYFHTDTFVTLITMYININCTLYIVSDKYIMNLEMQMFVSHDPQLPIGYQEPQKPVAYHVMSERCTTSNNHLTYQK